MHHLRIASVLAIGLSLGTNFAAAQHHHHHAVTTHSAVHHGSHYGHTNWNYVVPHHHAHQGAYYSENNVHYYTPSPIVPIIATPVQAIDPHAGHIHQPVQQVVVQAQKPVELKFDGFQRHEDLSGRLESETNLLCLELHYNYRNNQNFQEAYREAYAIYETAKYIHGKDHQGDRNAIRNRMVELDKLFHHVQEEVSRWTPQPQKIIGGTSLPAKLGATEAVLHHLCFDVGVKPHEEAVEVAPPPSNQTEIAPPPSGTAPSQPIPVAPLVGPPNFGPLVDPNQSRP